VNYRNAGPLGVSYREKKLPDPDLLARARALVGADAIKLDPQGRTVQLTRPGLKLGICGEHGGDPASITFCHEIELDYVSCSPYRVPIARLAAAQAALPGESRSGTA